jgi:hypothetical protein
MMFNSFNTNRPSIWRKGSYLLTHRRERQPTPKIPNALALEKLFFFGAGLMQEKHLYRHGQPYWKDVRNSNH